MIKPTIISFKALDSTSDYLKEHAQALPHLTMIFTDYQYHGRGQFDHVWVSNKGENILCSLLIKNKEFLQSDFVKSEIIKVLKEFFASFGIHTLFKEPNDLYVNHQKICGILIETSYVEQKLVHMIVGLGININQMDFGNLPATSLKALTSKSFDIEDVKNKLIALLSKSFN